MDHLWNKPALTAVTQKAYFKSLRIFSNQIFYFHSTANSDYMIHLVWLHSISLVYCMSFFCYIYNIWTRQLLNTNISTYFTYVYHKSLNNSLFKKESLNPSIIFSLYPFVYHTLIYSITYQNILQVYTFVP